MRAVSLLTALTGECEPRCDGCASGCDEEGIFAARINPAANSIENYWSLLKRGPIGSFHQVSIKHPERYMAEFDYRFNNRKDVDIFIKTIARMCNVIPMQYEQSLLLDRDPAL